MFEDVQEQKSESLLQNFDGITPGKHGSSDIQEILQEFLSTIDKV